MNIETPAVTDERRGCTSASNALSDSLCEGRHQAQKGIPQPPETEDARFGKMVHEALATGDTSKLDGSQLSIYDQSVEIRTKVIEDFFGPDALKAKRFIEQRLWCVVKAPESKQSYEHSGQPDLVVRFGPKALVLEYKTLPGDVPEGPANLQLRDQVVLASGAYMVKSIGAAVIQPLVTHSPSVVMYDEASIKRSEAEMFARVIKSNSPNAKRTAGPTQCQFCLARHTCKEYMQMVSKSVPTTTMSELSLVSVKDWTPEQRATFCERYPVAAKWIEECRQQIKTLIKESPDAVPGFKLEEGNKVRTVTNLNELHGRFLAAGGATKDFLSCMKLGMGNFETALRAATKLKGKALNAKVEELLTGIVEFKQNDSSITREK